MGLGGRSGGGDILPSGTVTFVSGTVVFNTRPAGSINSTTAVFATTVLGGASAWRAWMTVGEAAARVKRLERRTRTGAEESIVVGSGWGR